MIYMRKKFQEFSKLFQHSLLANAFMFPEVKDARPKTFSMKTQHLQHVGLSDIPDCICAFSQTLRERAVCYAGL